ncbi:hypothetical protein C8R26_14811 [Nitrosomonas oligotropha]|uniref:Uncharacterized protein n=1 Tax=Nitrosomonas oligotropha TaxID=42354 RepID=A0A2T5H4M0_9PROT|nr:hypothetical protein C8R26_14811 [Nitrosomonas oligotropha]
MDLLLLIVQVIKDLLGSFNPCKLISPSYRREFLNLWQKEIWIFKIGYIVGSILLIALLLSIFLLLS